MDNLQNVFIFRNQAKNYRLGRHTYEAKIIGLFTESNVEQLAFTTMRAAVVSAGIAVSDPARREEVELFVDRILEAMLIAGFAVFVTDTHRAHVMNPLEVTVRHTQRGWVPVRYNGDALTKSHHLVTLDEPLIPDNPKDVVRAYHWTSAARRSVCGAMRVLIIEEQWLQRDRVNSRAAAFTTIDKSLKTANANPIPFFLPVDATRNHVPSSYVPSVAGGTASIASAHLTQGSVTETENSNFAKLIQGRSNALRALTTSSELDRHSNPLDKGHSSDGSFASEARAQTTQNPGHTEHIITDGREFIAVPHLPSTTDARQQYDRARHSVLYTFGVPPQATGESVNSERTAANALQYEIAMQMFEVSVERLRERVATSFTKFNPKSVRISFNVAWTLTKVREIGPLLTTAAHIDALSRAHGVPKAVFDPIRIAAMVVDPDAADDD